jgi:hypothetical protein
MMVYAFEALIQAVQSSVERDPLPPASRGDAGRGVKCNSGGRRRRSAGGGKAFGPVDTCRDRDIACRAIEART